MQGTAPDLCRDAVVVLPGIMGSELVEADTGKVLWGLDDPGWYVRAWTTGSSLDALAVTDAEREGRTGRIRATRTLRVPAFAPLLRGFEPYTALLAAVRQTVADPVAVHEFAYDWRLGIDHNAKALAESAERHLAMWKRHARGSADARLVFVAHSMGGLVARYFTQVLGGARDVRATVTLGTPFYGAAKAVMLLSNGRSAPLPLPRRRLLRLARTLPGLHDLLPSYRCVDDGVTARCLDAGDVAALGGDRELAQHAFEKRARLLDGSTSELHALIGVQQPTIQSVRLADGTADALFHTCIDAPEGGLRRVDRRGDSTVYRDAASPPDAKPGHLPQGHGMLATSEEAIAHVRAILTDMPLGPPLGTDGVGLDLPDVVCLGEAFEIRVLDVEDPAAVGCTVERIDRQGATFVSRQYLARIPHAGEPSLAVAMRLPTPGLYRISAKAGAASAVAQLILCTEAEKFAGDGVLN